MEEIRNNPNITKEQIRSRTGKGKTAVDDGIRFLRKNGFIERVGSNKSGYWKVLEIE